MIEKAAEEYSKYLNINIDEKLSGVDHVIDDMLTRLEEFETLIVLVQQERCNAIGMTGHLSQALDGFRELKTLCSKIDVLEKMIEHADANISALENKVATAEEQCGLVDNSNKIKNLLLPLFKKTTRTQNTAVKEDIEMFTAEKYFPNIETSSS